jgi:hypothetical protein
VNPKKVTPCKLLRGPTRAVLRPEHHIVNISGGVEPILFAIQGCPVRSYCAVGFGPGAGTVAAEGDASLTAALRATARLSTNPSQLVPMVMQGADEALVQSAIADVRRTCDWAVLTRGHAAAPERNYRAWITPLDVPALYLSLPFILPGSERLFDIFRRYLPQAREEQLHEWPIRMHEGAGGHEVADKVIPFIEEVIAARDDA